MARVKISVDVYFITTYTATFDLYIPNVHTICGFYLNLKENIFDMLNGQDTLIIQESIVYSMCPQHVRVFIFEEMRYPRVRVRVICASPIRAS